MSYPELGPEEVHPKLGDYRIIDVREPHEFEGPLGRVGGSQLIPLGELPVFAPKLGDASLLLVCRSGGRSGKACEKLQALGVRDVTNLAGGMIAWNRAGLPIEQPGPASLEALAHQVLAWLAQVTARPREDAFAQARDALGPQGHSLDEPTHAVVDALVAWVASELADAAPPDLDLSLAAFRRALATL